MPPPPPITDLPVTPMFPVSQGEGAQLLTKALIERQTNKQSQQARQSIFAMLAVL